MKTLELQPTIENLLDTYTGDVIGRNEDVHRFIDILDSIEDCCVIALDGKWGSGKTFFTKQTKMVLDSFNEFVNGKNSSNSKIKNVWAKYSNRDLKPQVCVYYDAWENDNDEDPLISLVYEIMQSVHDDFNYSCEKDYLKLASGVFEIITGKNVNGFIDALKKGDDPFKEVRKSRDLRTAINGFLEALLVEKGERLIIFVDELDRCKPSYAVKLLERVKHYFNNDKVTFVFSINSIELQNTIKKIYGLEFDSCKYLDRFFDLRINLPSVDLQLFYDSIGFCPSNYIFENVMETVIQKFNFELREITRYVRLAKIAAYKPTHGGEGRFFFSDGHGMTFCLLGIVPIIIGLKMFDTKMYLDFIEGRNPKIMVEILEKAASENWLSSSLLTNDETFDVKDDTKQVVKLSDKLLEVYDALFRNDYNDGRTYEISVGQLSFSRMTQSMIDKTVNLLSSFTDFNY